MKQAVRIAKRNLDRMMATRHFPTCFGSRELYEEWLDNEAVAHTVAFRRNICEDCLPGFQAYMVGENRCANPQIILVDDIYKRVRVKKIP